MNNKAIYIIAMGLAMGVVACKSSTSDKTADTTKHDTVAVIKQDSTHLMGMWLDTEIKTDKGEQVAYQIVTQGPKTYIQVITFSGKKLNVNDNPEIGPSASLVNKTANNRYVGAENASEIYVIEKTGDLLIYDQTGFIAKCKRLL